MLFYSGFPVQSISDTNELKWITSMEDTSKDTFSGYGENTEEFLEIYEEFLALTNINLGRFPHLRKPKNWYMESAKTIIDRWTSFLTGLIQDHGIQLLEYRNEPPEHR
jgi:hypothetical protein